MRETWEVGPNTNRESVNIETREIGIGEVQKRTEKTDPNMNQLRERRQTQKPQERRKKRREDKRRSLKREEIALGNRRIRHDTRTKTEGQEEKKEKARTNSIVILGEVSVT